MSVADSTFLDNIDTALNAIITGEVASLSSNQRALTKLGIDQLMALKKEFEERIQAANASDAGGGHVLVSYGERQ